MARTTSPKRKLVSLSTDKRHALADAIAKSYGTQDPVQVQANAKYVYKIILNNATFPITRNGVEVDATLAGDCDEDTALHVTRLVMRKFTNPEPDMVQNAIDSLDLGV